MRNIFIKRSRSLIKAVIFFFVYVLFGQNSFSEGKKWIPEDAYVTSSIGDARILIPFLAADVSSGSICSMVYNGLTKMDKDLNTVGDLADAWEVSEDGLIITFYLRKNVKWHDGKPFTAYDVEFTYNLIRDPATGCPYISSYKDISEIKIIDPYTIKFYYKKPYAPALSKFGMGIIPKHLFEGDSDIRVTSYARSPIGTGPYKFSKWLSGQYIVLDANYDYFEHAPGIKRFVFRIVPDQAVQFLELVSGGIDSMDLTPYQYLYRSRIKEFEDNIKKYIYLAHSYTYIGYNLKSEMFKDARVRKALSYAINKKAIIDTVYLGLGEPCTGPFLKGTKYYQDSVSGYEYDPEKSKQLLKEAGWTDSDNDGILEKNGEDFAFTLVTNQGNQLREDIATIVQGQWREIGIKIEIQVVAWSAFLSQFIDKKNFQAVLLGWTIPIEPDNYTVWHSASINKGLNFISYSNENIDKLIEDGREEFDPVKRKVIYNRIHEILSEDAPYTFLVFPYAIPAVNKRFKGIEPAPAGIGYNFTDWHVDPGDVKYKF